LIFFPFTDAAGRVVALRAPGIGTAADLDFTGEEEASGASSSLEDSA
jgi:hypothetical protein